MIDEESNSLHVINTLLMAIHLSSALHSETHRKVEQHHVMKAPIRLPFDVKDCVSFARFCYLMACQEAMGTM